MNQEYLKLLIYCFVLPMTLYALNGVNLNVIFKKNRPLEARLVLMILTFSFSYLITNFILDFIII